MRGSLKIFTLFQIPVFVHWSFGLILLLILYYAHALNFNTESTLWLSALYGVVFCCVLLHEFGHSLAARRYKVETIDIILTPIGGIARLEKLPNNPWQEFVIAIAGPFVNIGIALLAFALGAFYFSSPSGNIFVDMFVQLKNEILLSFGSIFSESEEAMEGDAGQFGGLLEFVFMIVTTNLGLFFFNLIPAFPMDGGRVFRSLLALKIGQLKATRIASILGQIISVLFLVFGLMTGKFVLALIGFFILNNARSEYAMVKMDDFLHSYSAEQVMRRNFTRISENDWLQTPLQIMQSGSERNFLVFDIFGNLKGAIGEERLIQLYKRNVPTREVRSEMEPLPHSSAPGMPLAHVHALLRQHNQSIVPIVQNGEIIGVIDEPAMAYFMEFQTKLIKKT